MAEDNKAVMGLLDTLIILLIACTLVLFYVWLGGVLRGTAFIDTLPDFIQQAYSHIWRYLTAGAVGSAVLVLIQGGRKGPNYLLWSLGASIAILGIATAVGHSTPVPPPQLPALVKVPVRFRVQPPPTNLTDGSASLPLMRVAIRSPQTRDVTDALLPTRDPEYPYTTETDVPTSPDLNFLAELNPIVGARYDPNFNGHQYEICLKANVKRPFPASGIPEAAAMLVKLECLTSGKCPRTTNEPSYAIACEEPVAGSAGLLPAAYAAEADQHAQPGWIVPSLDSLSKMPERERVGYTRFDVMFTPEGRDHEANRYYYSLKVNEQPIYIDGFLPDRTIFPLQSGPNWVSFALENLNFTGEYGGFEKLHLTVIFLDGNKVVYRQELEREYVALRDAAPIPPIQTEAGTFQWTGKYVVPRNENRYEVLLASSDCGNPPRKDCVDRAVYAKNQFDKSGLTFGDKAVVMVVRPPLRIPAAYGLALGLVQPTTRQVQFTFNADEAAGLCHWAAEHVGKGAAGKLIRPDLNRYEVSTRGYKHCQ
jgi:hypothetical protein